MDFRHLNGISLHWLSALGCLLPPVVGLAQGDGYGAPAGYYAAADGLTGTALDKALHERIRNHTVITYSGLLSLYRATEVDPANSANLIMIYNGQSMSAGSIGTSGPLIWNREHLWPQSWGTSSGPGNSDAHHVFPCNGWVNEKRSNLRFDWTNPAALTRVLYSGVDLAPGTTYDTDSFEPWDTDKGKVARAMFYMATRYDGRDTGTPDLRLGNFPSQGSNTFGHLDALLTWNRMFAPNERERRRNHLIYSGALVASVTYKQGNRNPFIDYPELADAIYLPATTVSYGTWRWRHFTPAELDDPDITGDLADPDGDGLANLIELSANLDPRAAGATGAPRFLRLHRWHMPP
ncbi:MAG: endonuclease [Bacteroidales bacterium]